MEKPEENRNRWAFGLATTLSIVIFASFAFYKGYFDFGESKIVAQKENVQVAAVAVSSPLQNTKNTFEAAFDEIGKQYNEFKESVSNVLVPFITGIEVYER